MPESKLSTWGIIEVSGPEAFKFLHSQLTNSVENQPETEMRLAGFCTAKGRLSGSFFVIKKNDQAYLICKRDTIAALVKRLNMFKLRSKCEIFDASDKMSVVFTEQTDLPPMHVAQEQNALIASLRVNPDTGRTGAIKLIQNQADLEQIELTDHHFETELHSLGIAYISAATVESFIPQSINFDLVGGIHFEKGCYPGQEVVARSHYIGKVKRRAFLAKVPFDANIQAGQDVWMIGKTNEPAGSVITVCRSKDQSLLMIELIAGDALNETAKFSLKSAQDENPFTVTSPPYDVLEKGNQFA